MNHRALSEHGAINCLVLTVPFDGHLKAAKSILRNMSQGIRVYVMTTIEYKNTLYDTKTNISLLYYRDFTPGKLLGFNNMNHGQPFSITEYFTTAMDYGYSIKDQIDEVLERGITHVIYDDVLLFPRYMFDTSKYKTLPYFTSIFCEPSIYPTITQAIKLRLIDPIELTRLYKIYKLIQNTVDRPLWRTMTFNFFDQPKTFVVFVDPIIQPGYNKFINKYNADNLVGSPSSSVLDESSSLVVPPNKRIVYISLGTLFPVTDALWTSIFESIDRHFTDSDLYFIVTMGNKNRTPVHTDSPIIKCVSYANQSQILDKADFFITHGGLNGITEALSHKIPFIVIPLTGDQLFNAAVVKKRGFGLVVKSIAVLCDHFKKILNKLDKRRAILTTPPAMISQVQHDKKVSNILFSFF